MCRGFWLKLNTIDYDNLIKFSINMNGYTRLELRKEQLEIVILYKQE